MFDIEDFPKITFIMHSSTLKFRGVDLQNVPTSTGRADMIIRVMKSALYLVHEYNPDMGLILFPNLTFLSELAEYHHMEKIDTKGFLISFRSPFFRSHPIQLISEHTLLEILYESFSSLFQETTKSLFFKTTPLNFYENIEFLTEQGLKIFLLHEEGDLLDKGVLSSKSVSKKPEKICFVLGDQIGYSDIDLEALPSQIKAVSLGKTSFLGSTTITLIKWLLWHKQLS